MIWLIGIICIILVIVFWRIFLPLALIAAVGLGLLLLYVLAESSRSERERKLAEQTVRERIAKAKATAGDIVREWEVQLATDPASGEKVPRYASVLSDDGLCRLQVEERMSGARLTSIDCSGLKISPYSDIEVKFDNRSMSDTMDIERFSNSDIVYVPSYQYGGRLSYDEFLRRLTGANKVALLLDVEGAGQHWLTFSLRGSSPALTKIGALLPGHSGTQTSTPRKSAGTGGQPQSLLSNMSAEDQAWVNRSCPKSLGPSLWTNCVRREVSALSRGMPDLSALRPDERAWIRQSCPQSLGPSLYRSCVSRETRAVAGGAR